MVLYFLNIVKTPSKFGVFKHFARTVIELHKHQFSKVLQLNVSCSLISKLVSEYSKRLDSLAPDQIDFMQRLNIKYKAQNCLIPMKSDIMERFEQKKWGLA